MFIVLFRSFLAGLELNLNRHMLSQKKKSFNYALSYAFETFKEMRQNLELLSFQKMCALVGVKKKNESATAIQARTVLKGGWYH